MAAAVLFLLEKGEPGERYNIVGEEFSNLDIASMIAEFMGRTLHYELVDFHSSRPGHDLRYALDGSKLVSMGVEYPKDHVESLKKTVEWTLQRLRWLREEGED